MLLFLLLDFVIHVGFMSFNSSYLSMSGLIISVLFIVNRRDQAHHRLIHLTYLSKLSLSAHYLCLCELD